MGIFVTGTDTGVGKTLVSCALLCALRQQGIRAVGMKPVASGSDMTTAGLRNEDALALQHFSSVPVPYHQLNPYCFAPAIAPHLAARRAGVTVELSVLQQAYRVLTMLAERVIVEGAGGWRVPLEPTGYLSDLPEREAMPVVLVVGLRLGCLNHAVLTAEAIARGPCRLAGWVANHVQPGWPDADDNIQTLRQRLAAPCLGQVPFGLTDPQRAASQLDITPLR